MLQDELFRLYEHPTGAAAGVVDTARVGFQHLDKNAHHGTRGVELAATLAFGPGELAQEIFVHPAQNVFGAGTFLIERDAGNQVDQLPSITLLSAYLA